MIKHKITVTPDKLEPNQQQCLEMLSHGYGRIQELCQQAQEINNALVTKRSGSKMLKGLAIIELSEVNAELEQEVEFLHPRQNRLYKAMEVEDARQKRLQPVVVKKATCSEEFDKWLEITKQKDKSFRETLYGCPLKGSDGFCRHGRVPFGLKPDIQKVKHHIATVHSRFTLW